MFSRCSFYLTLHRIIRHKEEFLTTDEFDSLKSSANQLLQETNTLDIICCVKLQVSYLVQNNDHFFKILIFSHHHVFEKKFLLTQILLRYSQTSRILILYNDFHLTISKINKLTNVSRTNVRQIINSDSTRTHENARSKRFSKLDVKDVRRLVQAVINSADERRALYMKLTEDLEIQASKTIIRRESRKVNFRRCVICLKSFISWIKRRKRFKWARKQLHWKIEDWLRMIFNDESTFQTNERARQFVTRRSKKRYCSDCLSNFQHSKRESVIMWKVICKSHVIYLMKLKKIKKKTTKRNSSSVLIIYNKFLLSI
jgi:hypothetical protein